MNIPPRVRRGDPISADYFNSLRDAILSQRVVAGPGIRVGPVTAAGTPVSATARAGATGRIRQQFELAMVSVPSGGGASVPKILVAPGTVLGISPDGLDISDSDTPFYLSPIVGYIQSKSVLEAGEGGAISVASAEVVIHAARQESADLTFYHDIGYCWQRSGSWVVANACFGPLEGTVYRKWFVPEVTYDVAWFSQPVVA